MARSTINVKIEWAWEDGDGGNCNHCGDAMYGRMLRMIMVFPGSRVRSDFILCQSCGSGFGEYFT